MIKKIEDVQKLLEKHIEIFINDLPIKQNLKRVWATPEDVVRHIETKVGIPIINFEVEVIGRTYPYNDSNPYKHDLYLVKLKNGMRFKVERQYGKPLWTGNVEFVNRFKVIPN